VGAFQAPLAGLLFRVMHILTGAYSNVFIHFMMECLRSSVLELEDSHFSSTLFINLLRQVGSMGPIGNTALVDRNAEI
jgi:hypothetical protein